MAPNANRRIVLVRRPRSLPVPEDFVVQEAPVPVPAEGEVLVRTLLLSIDPAMRNWVLTAPSYSEPVPIGAVMRSFGVGEVVESRSARLAPGDVVLGMTGWQEWATLTEDDVLRRVDPDLAPLSTALGTLGISGLTAYVGIYDIGRPRAGETVLVATAAGSVGSIAGQLAARRGARVVGIAGSPEKCTACVEEFGFDACIDYRAVPDIGRAIAAACPAGVDVYFDTVGGPTLDAVLERINIGARIAVCGTISIQPGETPQGPRVERRLGIRRALIQGFLATDHLDRSDEIVSELARCVADGSLRHREDIAPSLDDAPAALERVLAGANIGKVTVRVAERAAEATTS